MSLCGPHVMRGILGGAVATTLQWRAVCSYKQTNIFQATCDQIYNSSSAREELRQLIHEASVENALHHLSEFSEDISKAKSTAFFAKLEAAQDALACIAIVLQEFEKWYIAQKAAQKVAMHEPWNWYPKARFMRRRFIYHYGPTNSGKTHAALEALVKAKSGVYCAPLKALAAQVWKRIDMFVPCDLLIGDERRFGGGAEHVSCTVEMTPIDYQVDVGVIDEVQMIADRDRGWAWTRALLGLPAREIHLCGEERAIPLIRSLLYKTYELRRLELVPHRRLVPLEVTPSLCGDLRELKNGDCLVCFSRKMILDMRKQLEGLPGVIPHCIYGSMPFSVREAQAGAFNRGVGEFVEGNTANRHVLISTDAIAYGLNMSIERIVFATMKKFDGRQMAPLSQATTVQVVGRAGRFGVARSNAVGCCTTLYSEDFALLNEAVNSPLPPLQKAGLLPTADILELYMGLHGGGAAAAAAPRGTEGRETCCAVGKTHVAFYEKIKEFADCCQASDDVLFPCDLSRSLLQVAKELETVSELTLSDRILFCYVPLNDHGRKTYDLLRLFAQDHAAGRHVRLRVDEEFELLLRECEHLRGHADARALQRILTCMEHVYRRAEMYCWLAWRFGKTFVHLETASALKEKIAAKIEFLLQRLFPRHCSFESPTEMGLCNILSCFRRTSRREECDDRRTIRPGYPSEEYCDNRVKGSKYTVLTFLPMSLFEQFHRPINLYFLLITAIQFLPFASSVSPLTTLIPLTIAFLITAIKEGVDDWRRHRLDKECNARRYNTINIDTLHIANVKSSDIRVGDLLLLSSMEVVPCDVVLLLSSDENGEVMISTEALDGESVCKNRYAVLGDLYGQRPIPSTTTVESTQDDEANILSAAEFIKAAACIIDSEGPKPFLNSYSGTVKLQAPYGNEKDDLFIGISAENVALHTSVLKNTRFVIGVAVLTGNETRVAMTHAAPRTKWSIIDQCFNRLAILVFVVEFILVAVFVILSGMQKKEDQRTFWYLGPYDDATALTEYALILPLRFFALVSPMVPLSFKVMLDTSKSYVSAFIIWDVSLSGNCGATEVHNSSLIEDLGQVEYVLTDKTGTLTCNVMTLSRAVTASGHVLTPGAPHEASKVKKSLSQDESMLQLMRTLVYCNTVERTIHMAANAVHHYRFNNHQQQLLPPSLSMSSMATLANDASSPPSPSHSTHSSMWLSPSPDEVALVEGAALLGVKLLERTRRRAFVLLGEKVESATIVRVLSFTPDRRRVSVLLQIDGDSRYLLVTKGSDESVLMRCLESSYDRRLTLCTLNQMSSEGLRTLVTAYRYLSDAEVQDWLIDVRKQEAIPSTDLRALSVAYSYERIEKELVYCGITAVVDHLQEDVCRTITQMRLAGMRVWMLTGDKSQTAKQTAIASGLVGASERVVALTPEEVESMSVKEHLEYVEKHVNYALCRKQFVKAEEEHRCNFSWYVRSGLRDFFAEFSRRISSSSLVCHPICSDTSCSRSYPLYNDPLRNEGNPITCDSVSKGDEGYAISLSGKTIELMKECGNEELFINFKRVLLHASTVICSRMTPDQKSFVVREVKKAGYVTLAIGDGGNDVSMIQCAHVGVGIKGREGNQAATASDFVISQFSFLSRLLLFHGHTAYQRSAIIVQQSFWKTVSLAWMQLLFNMYTDFSGVTFFDSFSLVMYDSLFTAPVTFFCVMNMPVSASVMLCNPKLYALSRGRRYLNTLTFYGYILRGFIHGSMIFFFAFTLSYETDGGILRNGHSMDRSCDFYVCFCALVTLHSCIILLETHFITVFHWTALGWSVVAMFVLFTSYALLSTNHSFLGLLENGKFYLQCMLGVMVPLVTLSMYAGVKFFFFPDLLQLQRLVLYVVSRLPHSRQLLALFGVAGSSRVSKSLSYAPLLQSDGECSLAFSMSFLPESDELHWSNNKNNKERKNTEDMSCDYPAVGSMMEVCRGSSALSEPFIKKL